jgi:hypothetical protein
MDAAAAAKARVEAAESPADRLALRVQFYAGFAPGWGDAELAFLRWEVERGVLAEVGGSAWWRHVQSGLALASEEAALRFRAGERGALDPTVEAWLQWMLHPTGESWYRAHNKTVVTGYLFGESLARRESWSEQRFLEIVLYRLLYAASLVDGDAPGCLPVPRWLARRVAEPKTASVDVLVHLPDFYPRHYPLTPRDVKHVLHQGFGLEEDLARLLDEGLVLPHAGELFDVAADDLGLPALRELCRGNRPSYPRPVAP